MKHQSTTSNPSIKWSEKSRLSWVLICPYRSTAFIVKHEVTIKVRKFEGLGKMTDQLLQAGYGLITIDSFEWKSENEENPEREALKAGVSDGQEICQRMGLKLSRIVSATEVDDKDEVD